MSESSDHTVNAQERKNRKIVAQDARDLRIRKTILVTLMGSKDGRRYIWKELGQLNIWEKVILPGEPEESAMREGRRLYGLRLLHEITAWTPTEYITMTKENAAVTVALNEDTEEKEDE